MVMRLAKEEHEVAYQDLCALVEKHAGKISALELLAVAANMLGKLIALQDQRTLTSEMAMEIVAINIEKGNQQALDQVTKSEGRA